MVKQFQYNAKKYIIYYDYNRSLVFYLPVDIFSTGAAGLRWSKHGRVDENILNLHSKLLMSTGCDVIVQDFNKANKDHFNMMNIIHKSFKKYIDETY